MTNVRRIYVEKRKEYATEAHEIQTNLVEQLGLTIHSLRIVHRYDVQGISEEILQQGINTILAEPMVDHVYDETFPMSEKESVFAIEFLPGQYDQRADSCEQCFQILTGTSSTKVRCAKLIVVDIDKNEDVLNQIKHYLINPVDQRIASLEKPEHLNDETPDIKSVPTLTGFNDLDETGLNQFLKDNGMAMNLDDLKVTQDYFKNEEHRDPTETEIKVLDTYWSDHCRHTTFATELKKIIVNDGYYKSAIERILREYTRDHNKISGEKKGKYVSLMDMATLAAKKQIAEGDLTDQEKTDEINACSIIAPIMVDGVEEEWLINFKNETHNHPTEIEPFGGAATCLGGAIRDPLSGRTYVYQAMRITGAADPRTSIDDTLNGKLPQRKIVTEAAHGYSSYGNQIGLATGLVKEIYHPNFVAKHMELGAVLGAAKRENVMRETSDPGNIIVLLGGRTGRDGIGGATGSSKAHTNDSIDECGAEVQKGNAPTERKIQRLFRRPEVTKLIRKCNDFGAGGVPVAVGELADGLLIDLDKVTKKYEGLDGTELAISESQERMAVVLDKNDVDTFLSYASEENLEATPIAEVTKEKRLVMKWRDKVIVDISREFLDTNGAHQKTTAAINSPSEPLTYGEGFVAPEVTSFKDQWLKTVSDLNNCSQRGLVERFDSSIGNGTVLSPFGGKTLRTETEGMVALIPVLQKETTTCSIMSYGYNPVISKWSPYHGSIYAIVESIAKIVAMGGNYQTIRFSFQEYFEKLLDVPSRWGKPFAALLGAYQAQVDLGIPAIGGKDSMSGSFGNLDVPPTLVAFAVGIEKAKNIISAEFKKVGSKLVLLMAEKNEDFTLKVNQYKRNLERLYELILEGKVISASSVKFGGVAETISKMAFGNKIGVEFFNLSKEELFGLNYGTLVLEVNQEVNINKEFKGCAYKAIGYTTEEETITSKEFDLNLKLNILENAYEKNLSKVFKIKTNDKNEKVKEVLYKESNNKSPVIKIAKPKVIIPVFPGTNCEYDCEREFKKANAETKTLVFRNYSKEAFVESIENLEKQIRESQIIMLPGGFSAGDEPDGSGKFIATVFRNEKIKDAVMDLLKNRDGLILGICNGFQALIKLGLVPYGEIIDIEEEMATLTYNEINRHMSSIIQTKVVSKKSPWFNKVNLGDIHNVAISHGEGRFVAPEKLIKELIKNGQVATQYVDNKGNISLNMPFNPNGSMLGIEGITSPDGRVLGKMGHSERIGDNLYKNIPGNFNQKIFESGVEYFR